MVIGICAGNPDSAQKMETMCREYFEEKSIYTEIVRFQSGREVLECKSDPDILLLDVELPHISGIEVKNRLEKESRNISIIFLAEQETEIRKAFGIYVCGFLLKKDTKDDMFFLFDTILKEKARQKWICICEDKYVSSKEILYIEADGAYTKVYLKNESHMIRKSLKEWEAVLPKLTFARCSRSHIVNLEGIYLLKCYKISLQDGTVLNVSRRMKKSFKECLKAYMKSV